LFNKNVKSSKKRPNTGIDQGDSEKFILCERKVDATTQEIADEAGVNRTLINYYFRSRDNLIQIIFDEAQK
jgi:hypothetical protein